MVFNTAALIVLGLAVFLIAERLAEDVPVFGKAHDRTTFFLDGFFAGLAGVDFLLADIRAAGFFALGTAGFVGLAVDFGVDVLWVGDGLGLGSFVGTFGLDGFEVGAAEAVFIAFALGFVVLRFDFATVGMIFSDLGPAFTLGTLRVPGFLNASSPSGVIGSITLRVCRGAVTVLRVGSCRTD